jgi:hypothetical protein
MCYIVIRHITENIMRPKIHQTVCQHCKKDFLSVKKTALYCSKSCRTKHLFVLRPELRKKASIKMRELRTLPGVQEKLKAHLFSDNNPLKNPVNKMKSLMALRERGYGMLNGGNGTPIPIPQRLLAERLGWPTEYVVKTKKVLGLPDSIKIDIANPVLKIAIEVDGHSHKSSKVKECDSRKDDFLKMEGWRILRFLNKEILNDLNNVVKKIMQCVKEA